MNEWLRSGTNLQQTKALKELINLALKKLPDYDGPRVVYRGVKIKGEGSDELFQKIISRYPEGKTVSHGEFISLGTSTDASFLQKESTKIIIVFKLKEISAAKDISDLADGIMYRGMGRSELLFPTDINFNVTKVKPATEDEKYTIFLEEK